MNEINSDITDLVMNKKKFIGGVLEVFPDAFDDILEDNPEGKTTKIKDIVLDLKTSNVGKFDVIGKDFECGFNIDQGGTTKGEEGWITFFGYGDTSFRIKECD